MVGLMPNQSMKRTSLVVVFLVTKKVAGTGRRYRGVRRHIMLASAFDRCNSMMGGQFELRSMVARVPEEPRCFNA